MGKVVKGFVRDEQVWRPVPAPPGHVDVTRKLGEELLQEALILDLPPRCAGLLKNLFQMPAQYRLALNLKGASVVLAAGTSSDNVAALSDDDIQALYEVEASTLTPQSRVTAWSLFDIPARREFVAAFAAQFLRARLLTKKQI